MKTKIESRINGDRVLFRWRCACGRLGAWLADLNDADRNAGLHAKHEHGKAVA